ncbi:MAG: choice-of-anchor J domain-containing protein [Candidatus Zixiibacteriota bacterium]
MIELYGSGTSWSTRDLYSPSDWGTFAEIAAGDFYAGNAGAEIAAISGSGDSNQVRLIYGSGTSWHDEKIMGTGGMYNYGVAIGNANRYRPGDELAVGGNRNAWEVQERVVIANNMQTLSIDNPAAGCTLVGNSSITIKATVINAATNTQSNVPVNLTISDGVSYTYTDAETTGTLVQGQTQQMIFAPDWTVPNSFASYTIKVKTALVGDEYSADDSLVITVTGVPPGYTTEGFEGIFPPADWTLQSQGTYTAPWTKSSAHAHSGTYSARGYYSSSGYTNEWLITPRLDLSVKSGGTLQFWKRFYAGSASYPDTLEILMSEDGGSTWPTQLARWTPDSTSDANFVVRTFNLSSSSNNVKIAFRYTSKNGGASYLDDVILPPIYVPPVKCGDVNNDGVVDVGDIVYMINYLYRGGPAPVPLPCVGDVNNDNSVDVGDVVYLINYLYRGGTAPDPNCCTPPWIQ